MLLYNRFVDLQSFRPSCFSNVGAYKICSPLIAVIIIGDYTISNLPSITNTDKDYANVVNIFKNIELSQCNVVFGENTQNDMCTFKIKGINGNDPSNYNIAKDRLKSYNFKNKWTQDEITDFNMQLKEEFLENNDTNYDSLIYVLSGHGDGKSLVYDSDGEPFMLSFIYHEFDNVQCRELRNKPKIYLIDSQRAANAKIDHKSMNNSKQQEEDLLAVHTNTINKTIKTKLQASTLNNIYCSNENDTYVQHTHKRTICCASGQQPMKWNSKCLENGSIFIQSFFHVLSKNLVKKSVSLTYILLETRKYMAHILRIPGSNNSDAIVLQDDSTMPYEIELNMIKDKNNDAATSNQATVCVYALF